MLMTSIGYVRNYEFAHLIRIMSPRYPVKRKSSWCCLQDSRPHTHHINRLLSEPPTYYWGRLL